MQLLSKTQHSCPDFSRKKNNFRIEELIFGQIPTFSLTSLKNLAPFPIEKKVLQK